MKTRTIRLADFCRKNDTFWHMMPVDAGQIVEVHYGMIPDGCGGGELIRRTHDRSDGSVSYDIADLVFDDDGECGQFEPWNGILPSHGAFEDCSEIGIKIID